MYLGKNFIFKGFDSFKHLVRLNLSGNDHTEVFWSIKLLMVVAHLKNIVQYMCQSNSIASDQSISSSNGEIYRMIFT